VAYPFLCRELRRVNNAMICRPSGAITNFQLFLNLDNRGFEFGVYPICAPVIPTLQFDARHGLTDEHAWGLYTTARLCQLAGPMPKYASMDPEDFAALKTLVRSAPRTLAREVAGDHFFLIGEKGARATIQAIRQQHEQVTILKHRFADLTHQPLSSIAF